MQSNQKDKMNTLLVMASQSQLFEVPILEDVKVIPKVNNITRIGGIFVDFDPPVVAVPRDWKTFWSLDEREKLNFADRITFENDLLDILKLEFILNSDEEPMSYFDWNLTRFDESGIHIQMNFSDPLLVSQSFTEDQLQIKLRKDFFL